MSEFERARKASEINPSSKRRNNIYPMFITHKLKSELLESTSPELIPIRLLQSAGNIFISIFTAFLKYILLSISVKFLSK